MTFHLRIRDEIKLLSNESTQQQLSQGLQPGLSTPKEFVVVPQDGTLPPNFQLPIQVKAVALSLPLSLVFSACACK